MKTSEADIFIVPGWSSSGEDHWQSRWQRNLRNARRIEQDDWINPSKDAWVARIVETVAQSVRPAVLVGHSLGAVAIVHAAWRLARLPGGAVVGAFLVAPADVENADSWPVTQGETFGGREGGFSPIPRAPLPFPAVLIASSNDPYCTVNRSRKLASFWNAALIETGDLGHINAASGHGPWPDGLLAFGMFLRRLPAR